MKKKFMLRVMAWLLAVAMLLPSAGNLFTAYAEEEKVADSSRNLVINFAELTAGGYGYEAAVNNGAVDVSITKQYQEIQYVLPAVVDLEAYTTLIVDVTSNAQLDIKLVNPEAEINQYNQKTPFCDFYTVAEPITAPISIDLASFASKDLSQINFMAMGDDTVFTIKSATFIAAPPKATPTPKPTVTPTPTPVPITEDTYKTVGDVLVVTADMVKNGDVVIERARYNSIVIPGNLNADVLLNAVKADEIVVEGGADYTVTLYYCDVEKVDVNAAELKGMTFEEFSAALKAEKADVEAIAAQFAASEAAKKAAAAAQVKLDTTYFTKVNEINVKTSAEIDAKDCEINKINMAAMDVAERLEVIVKNYDGAMSVDLDRAEGASAALFLLDVEDSKVSAIDVAGDDCTCFIEGDAKVNAINVADAAKVTLELDVNSIVVDETAKNAKVRVYSDVKEVTVKGEANSIVLPTCGSIGSVAVEGNNAKVYGYGNVDSAVVTGTGANVATYGTVVEGANDTTIPEEMVEMSPYKDVNDKKPGDSNAAEKIEDLVIKPADMRAGGWGMKLTTAEDGSVSFAAEGTYKTFFYDFTETIDAASYEKVIFKMSSSANVKANLVATDAAKDDWNNPIAFVSKYCNSTETVEVEIPLDLWAGKQINRISFSNDGNQPTGTVYSITFVGREDGPAEPIVYPEDGTLCAPNTWEVAKFSDVDFRQYAGKTVRITVEAMRIGGEDVLANGQFCGPWDVVHWQKRITEEWTSFGGSYAVPESYATQANPVNYGIRTVDGQDYSKCLIFYRNFSVKVVE